MNNFIFENATKAVFGQGCVKEYLSCMVSHYGPNVLLAYGGGSIKRNGETSPYPIGLRAGFI